jgi:hypothetical protein
LTPGFWHPNVDLSGEARARSRPSAICSEVRQTDTRSTRGRGFKIGLTDRSKPSHIEERLRIGHRHTAHLVYAEAMVQEPLGEHGEAF